MKKDDKKAVQGALFISVDKQLINLLQLDLCNKITKKTDWLRNVQQYYHINQKVDKRDQIANKQKNKTLNFSSGTSVPEQGLLMLMLMLQR